MMCCRLTFPPPISHKVRLFSSFGIFIFVHHLSNIPNPPFIPSFILTHEFPIYINCTHELLIHFHGLLFISLVFKYFTKKLKIKVKISNFYKRIKPKLTILY